MRKKTAFLGAVLLIAAGFSAVSCASAAGAAHQSSLTTEEKAIILSMPEDAVFPLVENTTTDSDGFLRRKALPADMTDPAQRYLAARMRKTVENAQGVGIAAPQVGLSRRIIWVQRFDKEGNPFELYFNPRITEKKGNLIEGWEGCLSVPAGYGKVKRAETIVVEYDTETGIETEKITGFTAVIFQHETDHLDGILFIDRKEEGDLIPKEEFKKIREKERKKKSPPPEPDQEQA